MVGASDETFVAGVNGVEGHVSLAPVVEALATQRDPLSPTRYATQKRHSLPSREALSEIVASLRAVLFPGYFSEWDLSGESLHFYIGATLDRVLHALQKQVKRGLCFECHEDPSIYHGCDRRAVQVTQTLLARLPEVRRLLGTDVEAAYEGDPAAKSYAEIIFSYPGLRAITHYRLAHELFVLGVPLIPRIMTEQAHAETGVDIHPGARIGEKFFIDHGTGVVIGETAVIGRGVRIYQGVTLGAKSFPLDEQGRPIKGIDRHPVVEDGVVIYAGATILGRVTVGKGSVIGGNVWLTRSVPPDSSITQAQARAMTLTDGAGI